MPQFNALSKYNTMWLYVMFDLPTNTRHQRKNAGDFRKNLRKDGFTMLQFSVYVRPCASGESAAVHIARVKQMMPDEGMISILRITDRQFSDTITVIGRKTQPPKPPPMQLELF